MDDALQALITRQARQYATGNALAAAINSAVAAQACCQLFVSPSADLPRLYRRPLYLLTVLLLVYIALLLADTTLTFGDGFGDAERLFAWSVPISLSQAFAGWIGTIIQATYAYRAWIMLDRPTPLALFLAPLCLWTAAMGMCAAIEHINSPVAPVSDFAATKLPFVRPLPSMAVGSAQDPHRSPEQVPISSSPPSSCSAFIVQKLLQPLQAAGAPSSLAYLGDSNPTSRATKILTTLAILTVSCNGLTTAVCIFLLIDAFVMTGASNILPQLLPALYVFSFLCFLLVRRRLSSPVIQVSQSRPSAAPPAWSGHCDHCGTHATAIMRSIRGPPADIDFGDPEKMLPSRHWPVPELDAV